MYEIENELLVWRNLMEDGTKCLSEEKYQEAENCYCQGLEIANKLTVPEIIAFTIRLLATVRVRLDKLDLAEQGFQEALQICLEVQNGKGMAEAWAGQASVSVKKGLLREACAEYEQAIAVYPSTSPPLRLGMLWADLGQVYEQLEESGKAQEAYIKAREICRLYGFSKGEGEMEVLLGELSYKQGKKREAAASLRHACQLFAPNANMLALTNTLQYLALIYFDQNELESAFACQQRAVALCLKFDDDHAFSESCFFLSKIEQLLENYAEAKYYLELSIAFYPKPDLDLALRYQSLAGLFLVTLDFHKAELYYEKALSFFESIHDEMRIREVYEAMSVLKEIQEQKENPVKTSEPPVYQAKYHAETDLEALVRLAEVFENRRCYRDALDCYWKALALGKESEIITDWIEMRVQRVSKRLREKNK